MSGPDTYAGRARESASKAREKIAKRFEPGVYAGRYGTMNVSMDPEMRSVIPSASYSALMLFLGLPAGDTKATSRRLSDTPSSVRQQFREFSPKESANESVQKSKSMLQNAQETVAKALGGGSRGELVSFDYVR